MNNYQLYRTNPRLSGQMKWNLTIKSTGTQLEVEDFRLVPINKNIPLNFSMYNDDLLQTDHLSNIRKFYTTYENDFYNCGGNQSISTSRPILSEETEIITSDQFDSTYNMGVSRISHKMYGKQFAVFCPMWIEKIQSDVLFKIECYAGNTLLTYKTLKLDINSNQRVNPYHSKFESYLKQYLESINLFGNDSNGEEIMYIDLSNNTCSMNVVDIDKGLRTINNNDLAKELLYREMPLMFFDYKIISTFKANKSISRQLYNFNILFDIDDLLNEWEMSIFRDKLSQFNIKIKTLVDGEPLEIVDFYTNYDFIPKIDLNGGRDRQNVLDYLQDNKCVDLIDKNKIIPTICHWSLVNNDNYIFNAYDGFSAVGTSRNYNGTPDLNISQYANELNNFYWWTNGNYSPLEFIREADCEDFIDCFTNDEKIGQRIQLLDRMTGFGNNKWVNNIKYTTKYQFMPTSMKICISELEKFPSNLSNECWKKIADDIYYLTNFNFNEDTQRWEIDNDNSEISYIYFVFIYSSTSDKSHLTFNSLIKSIPALKEYFDGFDITSNPPAIYIDESVAIQRAKSPVKSIKKKWKKQVKEITYYKFNDLMRKYLYRYSGYIRPSFIHGNGLYQNYLYYIQKMNSEEYGKSLYSDKENSFPAIYPSIDFCPIKYLSYVGDLENNLYESIFNNVEITNEGSWFNMSKMYYLPVKMEWQIIHDQNEIKKEIKDIVRDKFKDLYGEDKCDYIMSLYDYESSFDYENNTTVSKYKYDIKLTLK